MNAPNAKLPIVTFRIKMRDGNFFELPVPEQFMPTLQTALNIFMANAKTLGAIVTPAWWVRYDAIEWVTLVSYSGEFDVLKASSVTMMAPDDVKGTLQ